jgi:hypothetical protein
VHGPIAPEPSNTGVHFRLLPTSLPDAQASTQLGTTFLTQKQANITGKTLFSYRAQHNVTARTDSEKKPEINENSKNIASQD